MPIWKKSISLEAIHARYTQPHMGEFLGIEFLECGEDFISARMPVNERTHQPYGILHGGASVVLAETLGSVASDFCVEEGKTAVGLEINANHLRPVRSGFVTGVCKAVHIGGKTHVWDIRLYTDDGKLVCISRLTTAVIPKV